MSDLDSLNLTPTSGRPANPERIQRLIDAVRANPGHRCGWYADQLATDRQGVSRLLASAERIGVHFSEDGQGGLHYVGIRPPLRDGQCDSNHELDWLDRRVPLHQDGVRNLLSAVIVRAVWDIEAGEPGAREWFNTDRARQYVEMLELDHRQIMRHIRTLETKPKRKGTHIPESEREQYIAAIRERHADWVASRLPFYQYCRTIDIHPNTLRLQFLAAGFSPTDPSIVGTKRTPEEYEQDTRRLYAQYCESGLPIRAFANQVGIDQATLRYRFKRFGLTGTPQEAA